MPETGTPRHPKVEAPLRCPNCGRTDLFTLFEVVPASTRVNAITESDIEWSGTMDYGDSTESSDAISCECGWEYQGKDWKDQLSKTPVKAVNPAESALFYELLEVAKDRGELAPSAHRLAENDELASFIDDDSFWSRIGGPAVDRFVSFINEQFPDE